MQRDILLDLCNDQKSARDHRAQLLDVARAAHEAQREIVEILLNGEVNI